MKKLTLVVLSLIALSSCTSTTSGGVVGVNRPQFLMGSSRQYEQEAALLHSKVVQDAASKNALVGGAEGARVKNIAQRLIAQVGVFRTDALNWNWRVELINSPKTYNAFCMAGGKIVVYTGLTKGLNLTDDEIAAVLGHEISHALREHTREKQARQAGIGILQEIAGIAIGAAVKNPDAASIAKTALPVATQLGLTLPHSRGNESEADKMGLELMARAGFNPYAAISFWQKLQNSGQGSGNASFFSTHPSDKERIRNLEALMPKVMPLYQQATAYKGGFQNQARTFR